MSESSPDALHGDSGQSWRVKLTAFLGLGLVLTGCNLLYEVRMVSGDMVPKLSRRGSQAAMAPARRAAARNVDLTTTTADDFPQFLGPGRRC